MSSSISEDDESLKQSRHLEVDEHETFDTNDSDGVDDDDDDDGDEWEDIDDEWVTDSDGDSSDEHKADYVPPRVTDNCHYGAAKNCPDILTGPQLIELLQTLCLKDNRRADVHTVGLVCMLCDH